RVAVFGGAGLAHDLAALDRLLLIRRVFRVPVRHQLLGREQLRVRLVRVQHQEQGRPLVDDPHPRMAVPVDPPLVPLRRAEPPLQAQVVPGQARPIRAPAPDEHPPSPPPPALGTPAEDSPASVPVPPPQLLIPPLPLTQRPRLLIQRRGHRAHFLQLQLDLLLLALRLRQPPVDVPRQPLQLTVSRPGLVQGQVPPQRGPHLRQRRRHPQPRRGPPTAPALAEDAAHRGAT